MKKILHTSIQVKSYIIAILLFFPLVVLAQDKALDSRISTLENTPLESNQNPHYLTSYRKYSTPEKIREYTSGQSTTLHQTYKAIDPWQDKKDARHDRRVNRYKLRHERRIARIENRPRYVSYYNPVYSIVPEALGTALLLSWWW